MSRFWIENKIPFTNPAQIPTQTHALNFSTAIYNRKKRKLQPITVIGKVNSYCVAMIEFGKRFASKKKFL